MYLKMILLLQFHCSDVKGALRLPKEARHLTETSNAAQKGYLMASTATTMASRLQNEIKFKKAETYLREAQQHAGLRQGHTLLIFTGLKQDTTISG